MIKLLLIALLSISLFGNDLWQVGFQQGTSIFNIENSKKERLSFECGYTGGSIYLYNKGKEIVLKDTRYIDFIINDEKKLSTLKSVSLSETTMNEMMEWGNLVYEIPTAKKIIVEANNQKFTFEPSNLKELQDFVKTCTEYETSDSNNTSTQTTNNNNTSNTNATATFDSNKPPFRFSFEDAYDGKINKLHFPLLVFTSLKDQLIVKDIKINKGKCAMANPYEVKYDPNLRDYTTTPKRFPMTIKEFETVKFSVSSQCNILRVDIETNNGTWTFGEN